MSGSRQSRLGIIALITFCLVFLNPSAESITAGVDASAFPARSGDEPTLAGSPTSASPEENCAAFETATDFVEFDLLLKLQGRSIPLRFPSSYVDNPRGYRNGAVRITSYIRVDIDTFEPISRAEDGRRFKAGVYDSMGGLFRDAVSLEEHAVIDANLATHLRRELSD
jgi:hypothetical protein